MKCIEGAETWKVLKVLKHEVYWRCGKHEVYWKCWNMKCIEGALKTWSVLKVLKHEVYWRCWKAILNLRGRQLAVNGGNGHILTLYIAAGIMWRRERREIVALSRNNIFLWSFIWQGKNWKNVFLLPTSRKRERGRERGEREREREREYKNKKENKRQKENWYFVQIFRFSSINSECMCLYTHAEFKAEKFLKRALFILRQVVSTQTSINKEIIIRPVIR